MVSSGILFAHGFGESQLDAVRVVNEPIEDGVGDATAAEILVPVADRQLRGDDRGPDAVSLFKGFQEILLFTIAQAGKTKIIEDEDGGFRQTLQEPIIGAVGARLHEEIQQCRQPQILDGEAAATGVLAERLGDKALAGAGEAGNQQRLMGRDPTVLRQLQQLIFAQAAGGL